MRRAREADLPAIRACLGQRPELAMFPQSNLDRFGFEGDHDYAPFFWVNDGAAITDVLTIGRGGMVMPFLPSGDTGAAREVLRGRRITGIIGPASHARPLMAATGLDPAACLLDRDEPQFAIDLADLNVPDAPGHLIALQEMDLELFKGWRTTYHVEALGESPDRAGAVAEKDIESYAAADSHRALIVDGAPVAMTGFNARLPGIVQIGAVFTPEPLRRRGYARLAVALHLQEVLAAGVTRATLFSANAHASRAYIALGFERIGAWSLILTRDPVDV